MFQTRRVAVGLRTRGIAFSRHIMRGMTFALRLLPLTLTCCVMSLGHAAFDVADPGRLNSANVVTNVPRLRPCNDGAQNTLHIDSRLPVNVLVYGYNGSSANLLGLAKALASFGQQTVCFEYDGRDRLMLVSSQLADAIDTLAQHLETPEITVIGHSIGGLVARKALIKDRPDPIRNREIKLRLVTISTPFAGIDSARRCSNLAYLEAKRRFVDLFCWVISGDNWDEITPASDFIRTPGNLIPQIRRHILVVTDERGSCRRRIDAGLCIKTDFVFTLGEQQHAGVINAPRTAIVRIRAGHAEIIGGSDVTPNKLIDLFQREGIVY